MNNLLLLSLGISIVIIGIIILLFAPNKRTRFELSNEVQLDPTLNKAVKLLGGDVSALFPTTIEKQRKLDKINNLIITSGNPWKLTLDEFIVVKLVCSVLGVLIGCLASFFTVVFINLMEIPSDLLWLLIPSLLVGGGYLGFIYPNMRYEKYKYSIEKDFQGNLPEAIDYLIMILSTGGISLPVAFEMSLEYLPKGAVYNEFSKIVSDLRSGKTMETALNEFSDRVPTEGIKAFTKALNNANKLSVSVIEILKDRAEVSRKELELEIEKRLSSLPVKIMGVLSPASAFSIMLIALAPSASALLEML